MNESMDESMNESNEPEYSLFNNKADYSSTPRDKRVDCIYEALALLNMNSRLKVSKDEVSKGVY